MLRWLMSCLFAALATAKLIRPDLATQVLVPPSLYFAAISVEFVIAMLFAWGRIRIACVLGMMFFIMAVVVSTLLPPGECGCLGALAEVKSKSLRVFLAGSGGFICALIYALHESRSGDQAVGSCTGKDWLS